jgi:hypothetical protein
MCRLLTEREFNALCDVGEGPPLTVPKYTVINLTIGPIVFLEEGNA